MHLDLATRRAPEHLLWCTAHLHGGWVAVPNMRVKYCVTVEARVKVLQQVGAQWHSPKWDARHS